MSVFYLRFLLRCSVLAALIINVQQIARAQVSKGLLIENSKLLSEELLFQRFFTKEGLPDDRIKSLVQSNDGFIWVGTMDGLARYDGHNFITFNKGKKQGNLSDNLVYAITKDGSNNVWIATTKTIEKFDVKSNTFSKYNVDIPNATDNSISTLSFDNRGKLWVGTIRGLRCYDTLSHQLIKFKSSELDHPIQKILCSRDIIWIATKNKIIRYDISKNRYDTYPIKLRSNAFGKTIWSLLQVGKDLYIATAAEGVIKLPFDEKRNGYGNFVSLDLKNGDHALNSAEVFDLCWSKTGDMWLATGGGLGRIENLNTPSENLQFYTSNSSNNKSISHNEVYTLYIDQSNVLWCGTESGLNKLDLNSLPFHYYTFRNKKSDDLIRGVYSLDGKSIWFCKELTGFYNYNTLFSTTTYFKVPPIESFLNRGRSILVDHKANQVWVGTIGGLMKINHMLNQYQTFLPGHAIFTLLLDHKGNLWAGTNEGLYEVKNSKNPTTPPSDEVPRPVCTGYVRALFEDSGGKIWVGFSNEGLGIYDPEKGKYHEVNSSNGEKVVDDLVNTILEYPKNVIWAATESGLLKITPNSSKSPAGYSYKIKHYLEEIPEKSINGMVADGTGKLWIITKSGLIMFNSQDQSMQSYLGGVNFGLRSFQRVNGNCLLFGTSDGFVVFDPAKIPQTSPSPLVAFTSFKIFNKEIKVQDEENGDVILTSSINTTKRITLGYKNNVFSVGFASLHFTNPDKNGYAYLMEGFDKDWTYANASNSSATYTNLDPGTYYFKVKATNYLGRWSKDAATLQITILPPPWKSWWAYLLYFLVIAAFIYGLFRYFIFQTKQKHQLYLEHAEKEQLKSLNEMKVRFFTDISHEFRTPLSLIVAPAEDIAATPDIPSSIKGNIGVIYRNCKKLLYLIDELMTFQKLENNMLKLQPVKADFILFLKEITDNFKPLMQKKLIDFHFDSETGQYNLTFDPGKMEMVLNNLLFNAIKFSNTEGIIRVTVKEVAKNTLPDGDQKIDKWLEITVEDNGKGITPEKMQHVFERYFSESSIKGTGVGLSLTKNLVEIHGGIIKVESEPNVKTVFYVYLPIIDTGSTEESSPLIYSSDKDVEMFADDDEELYGVAFEENHSSLTTILIVDDNKSILNHVSSVFRSRYKILKASNGQEALKQVKQANVNLIISDVMMPEMSGYELSKMVKENIETSHIPIILLSAKSTIEEELIGLESGADDYLTKPYHLEILRIKVEKLLARQKDRILKVNEQEVIIPKDIATNPLDEKFLKKVLDTIEVNLGNEEFSVEDMGNIVAMSRSNLFRKLKAVTGKTPIELLYDMRLQQAMKLLLERKHNISEITYLVGFKRTASLITAFKRKYGKAPLEYLNNLLANHESQ